nr:hypothetical protein [Rhodoferax sp.]
MNFFSIVTRIGAVIGALVLFAGVSGAKGAPQEAAAAGIAIALGVLPYVMYRVLQLTRDAEEQKAQNKAILQRLDAMIEAPQSSK